MNYEMIDTKKLDERGRQIIITLNSDYPIFKTMAKLNVSLFGGVLFDGDNVSLIMYLEKPADMKREDSIFLSKVPHKDLGDFVVIKDSSKEFSELLALGQALRVYSVILDTIHFNNGKVVIYLRYLMADEAMITRIITFSNRNIPAFSLEYLGKSEQFGNLIRRLSKFAGISIVSLTFSPLSKEKNPDSKLKDYIMEVKYAEQEKIVCVYNSSTDISGEKIHRLKKEPDFYSGEIIDDELSKLLSFLTVEEILTFRRVVKYENSNYNIDFYLLKSAQKIFLKRVSDYVQKHPDNKLSITEIQELKGEG